MQLNCTGVIRRPDDSALPTGEPVVLESIDLPNTKEQLGRLTYLAVGASTPKVIGYMHRKSLREGGYIHPVNVAFDVNKPQSNAQGHFKTEDDIRQCNYLDVRWINKAVSNIIIPYWYEWLKSDDPYAQYVQPEFKNKITTGLMLKDHIYRYPAFLDYLSRTELFSHIEVTLFGFSLNRTGVVGCALHKIPSKLEGRLYSPLSPQAKVLWPSYLPSSY